MKQKIISEIDMIKDELIRLSHDIHSNPEIGFQEKKAVTWQTKLLQKHGFNIEYPYCKVRQAFKATFKCNDKGPKIAFLSEYDALPEIGHGCGHNIIAASAVGAAIGLSKVVKNVPCEVMVIGTPAEEGGGGKIHLVDAGAFDDVDFAIMVHPATKTIVGRGGTACTGVALEYFGVSAHSAGPEYGVNALSALIAAFNNINSMRQSLKDGVKINGIIKSGGVASNIIPGYAKAEFTVRAKTRSYLMKVINKMQSAAKAAALTVGAKYKFSHDLVYAERYPNLTMGEVFKTNLESLGEKVGYPSPDEVLGSSDIGNVTMIVPTIHEYIAIAHLTMNTHTKEFAKAAKSERADKALIKAAKAMAMTGYDILVDKDLQEKIYREFKETVILGSGFTS